MKTILILVELVALSWGKSAFKNVDADYVSRQLKVLSLFEPIEPNDHSADYFKIGKNYDIESNIANYTDKRALKQFLTYYKTGFLPKYYEFSIFHEKMRDEAIALFRVLYYAKGFETFYNTTAWAKLHINEGQFFYVYYIALRQRPDTQELVLPAPYELYHRYFFNMDKYFLNDDNFDRPSFLTYPNAEHRLAYFTEDVDLNAHYYYFHTHLPFWWNSDKFGEFKERRGEGMFNFYRKITARYSFERDANGLGKIPEFSWFVPFKTGYYPQMTSGFSAFTQRSNNYNIYSEMNFERINFLDAYEKTFYQYLQQGPINAFDKVVNFTDPKAINFIGNYWETNADLYSEEYIKNYQHSYEVTARHVLGGSPKSYDKYSFLPSALDYYQTSLRDPASYQLLQRIVDYFVQYMQHLQPHSCDELSFKDIKINDVIVSKLVTYFENIYFNSFIDLEPTYKTSYLINQHQVNHEAFSVNIAVKSNVSEVVFKIFLGPKYQSNGYPINVEVDWVKFIEVDWFVQELKSGPNNVIRNSSEFLYFKEDSFPTSEIRKYLKEGKVPNVMTSGEADKFPRRMMLPRGTDFGNSQFQFCVFIYPYIKITKEKTVFQNFVIDNKPSSYPFDRPVNEACLKQSNVFFKEVKIYHKGAIFPYQLNTPANIQNKLQNVTPDLSTSMKCNLCYP